MGKTRRQGGYRHGRGARPGGSHGTPVRWIDILINNAAVSDHHGFSELTRQRLELVLAVNLIGPILGMQAVLPLMLARGGGAIVNISSVNGLRGTAGMAGYDASKWAVRGVTKSVALEYGVKGIRVNSVHPGAISTPMLDPEGTLDGNALAGHLRIAAGRIGEPRFELTARRRRLESRRPMRRRLP